MHAIRQELLPPSGISHAVALRLVPPRTPLARPEKERGAEKVVCQLVVARSSLLRVFEVRERGVGEEGREEEGKGKQEEVKLEPEETNLDGLRGEAEPQRPTTTHLHLIREHRVHGIVTGLSSVRTLASADDGLDRLLVAFKDAKIALLEWSDAVWDLSTVSIHTYERAPQVASAEPYEHRPLLRSDPSSRVAVLLLPRDALAVLPLYQKSDLAEFQARDAAARDVPYSPSYVLDLPGEVDEEIRHVLDLVFLPGFVTPTLAVLYQSTQTWTGRLSHHPDPTALSILTLDPLTRSYPLIARTRSLPHDAFSLLPSPHSGGGVVVLCSNSVLHIDGAGRVIGLATSRWHAQVSALKLPVWDLPEPQEEEGEEGETERALEGCRATFLSPTQLLLLSPLGLARELTLIMDGRTVSALRAGRVLGRTVCPSVVCHVGEEGERVLVGSEAGDSVLLRVRREVEPVPVPEPAVVGVKDEKPAVVGEPGAEDNMSIDEDDLYADSAVPEKAGGGSAALPPRLALELCDTIGGWGPVADMAFALSGSAHPTPHLILSTPSGPSTGVFTSLQRDFPLRVRRKVPVVAGSQGIWSLVLRREGKAGRTTRSGSAGGAKVEEGAGEAGEEGLGVLVSTDATPSPGISRTIVKAGVTADVRIESRIPTLTIAAGTLFSRTCIMQVTVTALRLLDADGKELQSLKDTESNKAAAPIRTAVVADPYVLVQREDGAIALYVAEGGGGKRRVRWKSLPAAREKTPTYGAVSIYTDGMGLLGDGAEVGSPIATTGTGTNLRKRAASPVLEQEEGDPAAPDEEHLSIQPETKRARVQESEDLKDKEKEVESGREKKANGSSRSGRREHSRERGKEREREKDKGRREDGKKDEHKEGRGSSSRHRSSAESSRRHKEGKDTKDAKDGKDTKENGVRKTRHRSERAETVSPPQPQARQWLLLYNANGRLEIWSLPQMTLAFTSLSLSDCPVVLEDEVVAAIPPPPAADEEAPPALEVEQVILAAIGDRDAKLYLLVYYTIGRLAVYEAVPSSSPSPIPDPKRASLNLRFIKVASRFVDAASHKAAQQLLPEARRYPIPMRRTLMPFVLEEAGVAGVFQKGEEPCWIVGTRQGGLRIHSSPHQVVHAFTPTSIFGSNVEFLMYTEEGPLLMELDTNVDISHPLPSTKVTSRNPYTSMTVDPSSGLLAAASSLKAPFLLFDEDEQPLWTSSPPALFGATCDASSVELIVPDSWQIMHGYEFGQNEFVNTVASVTLETPSTESGVKDYIAVGTSVYRGEDLAVRGGTYIFEIIEVVSSPDNPSSSYRLKLLCRDEAKAPVTAICSLNGYLVSSMGLKLYVRAFEMDERLVGVAFMDVGVAVTSVTCLKNLLLVGDANRSVSFVAFQEDPFKLVLLARDQRPTYITNASFLFSEDGDFGIIAADDEGALRVFDYDPGFTGVTHGNPLLCRTEFNGQAEHTRVLTIAHRYDAEEMPIPRAELIYGTLEGSLCTVMPVTGDVFKRLQLLSGQLTRSVQHFAGLNPRAFRTVRNEHLTRPLNRGILDGNLLHSFYQLDTRRQAEITKQIGTDTLTILRDFKEFQHVW